MNLEKRRCWKKWMRQLMEKIAKAAIMLSLKQLRALRK